MHAASQPIKWQHPPPTHTQKSVLFSILYTHRESTCEEISIMFYWSSSVFRRLGSDLWAQDSLGGFIQGQSTAEPPAIFYPQSSTWMWNLECVHSFKHTFLKKEKRLDVVHQTQCSCDNNNNNNMKKINTINLLS